MDKVTIADCSFLQYEKSCSIGGENHGVGPTNFEWELDNARNARFVTDSFIKDAIGEGQVALILESFFLHPENYLIAMQKPFDYVLTTNRYFETNRTNWLWYPHCGSWIAFDKWGLHEKTKNISLILSEKRSMRGHALRHEVVERFGKSIDDIYGYDHRRIAKFDGLAPYRYSVVIEPERCDGLFSEHLIDCISVGTIPIYWGCRDIGEFFVESGIVKVDNLDDIKDALDLLGEKDYKNYLDDVKLNLKMAEEYRIAEDWIFNQYPFLFERR